MRPLPVNTLGPQGARRAQAHPASPPEAAGTPPPPNRPYHIHQWVCVDAVRGWFDPFWARNECPGVLNGSVERRRESLETNPRAEKVAVCVYLGGTFAGMAGASDRHK